MRILQVCSYLYPALTYGGPAKMVYDLSLELSENNHVTIYTTDVWDSKRRITKKEKLISKSNLTVRYFSNIFNSLAFKIRFFTGFGMVFDFVKNSNKYDIIHFHDVFIFPQLFIALLAIVLKTPFVVTPHGVLDPVRLEKKTLPKKIMMPLASFCLKRAKVIIAVSDKEAKDLKKIGFNNVKTVWNGVSKLKVKPSEKFSEHLKRNITTLLYIGKIHPQKGLKEVINSLSKSKLIAQLLIAGPDDGGKQELKKIVREKKLNNVHFLGFVGDREKKELYKLSDIFVHPSYAEGFSISILEAMQERLPVIISDGCNFKEVKKSKAGFIVKVEKLEKELTEVFNKIALSKADISKLGKNGAKLIKSGYTISKMSSENYKIYEQFV
jgi:glycosyltransferase involved in cell wall biosynthesis